MSPAIRNAFVLGAGLGTRLRGITANRPKPLIPVCGKPLIAFAFDRLLQNGVTNLVVNTHHCPEVYARHFPDGTYRDAPIHFAHEEVLLETGGGIKNVEPMLRDGPFIVYNGDVLANLPFERAIAQHFERGNEVTMVLRSVGGPLQVALDQNSGRVTDIRRTLGTREHTEFLFAGIYVVNPEFFARIPAATKISVVPVFLEMIRQGARLGGVVIDDGQWWDLGTREQYLDVHRFFRSEAGASDARRWKTAGDAWPVWIDPTAEIAPDARLLGATAIGARATVRDDAVLDDCIIWEDAEIGVGSRLKSCIVTAAQRVHGTHSGADF